MKRKIIEAKGVSVYYNMATKLNRSIKEILTFKKRKNTQFWALNDINFEIQSGEIIGVVGSNGSGKTTLLKLIAGIFDPDKGTLRVNGKVSTLLSIGTGFKEELSGIENIFLNAILLGFKEKEVKEKLQEIINFSEIGDFVYQPIKKYSAGMKARLGFSISAHLNRDIMLVDEILGVGDFKFKEKSRNKMKELIKANKTVILVSHNMESIKEYSDKVLWIEKGVQKAFGDTESVVKQYLNS